MLSCINNHKPITHATKEEGERGLRDV